MLDENGLSPLIRIRNLMCFLYLVLALLSETYTAAAIALDRFIPSWYRTLGWSLFLLPCALAVGLFLVYVDRGRLGFYIIATSLLLYGAAILFDVHQGHAARGDWLFAGIWLAFCSIGIFAAKLLIERPGPSSNSQVSG